MSHSKNYDNNKNNVQLISNLVESLNEALVAENASVDRIISRIDQTPIHEIKQILMQHLDETFHQKVRLECIILKNQIYQNWTDKN
jgi:ferritin-like metal-binding protein YciE